VRDFAKVSQGELLQVSIVFLDFDGVLTDNTVMVDSDGRESVVCWRGDGIGIQQVSSLKIPVCVISTEVNSVVDHRARKLKINFEKGIKDKALAIESICARLNLSERTALFLGNDVNDIPGLKIVGLPLGVADLHENVKPHVRYVTKNPGGRGAVREVCDALLAAHAGKRVSKS